MASVGVTICYWVVQILGTMVALMFTLVAGFGKLCPCHPMNGMMVGMEKTFTSFLGLSGCLMRIMIGLSELAAGICILYVLWFSIPPAYVEFYQVLLICAFIGLLTVAIGIVWFHYVLEGNGGAGTMFAPVMSLLLICRLQVTPLSEFKDQSLAGFSLTSPYPFSMLEKFCTLCLFGFVIAIALRLFCGKSMVEIREEAAAAKAAE